MEKSSLLEREIHLLTKDLEKKAVVSDDSI